MERGERRSIRSHVVAEPFFANVWCKKNSTPLFNPNQQDLTPNCAVPGKYGFFMSFYFIVIVPEFGSPSGPGPTNYPGFTITLRHTTLCRTSPDERSARRRDLYLTTQHSQETGILSAGFEPTFPASERPQTHALEPTATGIGVFWLRPV